MLRLNPGLRPVFIPENVLGNDMPLRLSPPHSVCISDVRAELYLGSSEVLLPAAHLIGRSGVYQETTDQPVVYYHLLFDYHEILWSNGCWSESLYLGDAAHAALAHAADWHLLEGVDMERLRHKHIARPVLKRYETELICAEWPRMEEVLRRAA